MPTLPENSVDAIVCDPPYGLEFMGKEWDAPWKNGFAGHGFADGAQRKAAPQYSGNRNPVCKGCHKHKRGRNCCACTAPAFDESPASNNQRLQSWFEAWARSALRVAKPGAHLVAFGGTRTFHRLTCAIEDAGWEIRDCLSWLYGSGFPKSLDVSKAMDKVNGETDRLHRFTAWMRTTGLTARQLDDVTGTAMGGHYLTPKSQPAIPTPELWATIRPLLVEVPEWVDLLVERIAAEREVIGQKSAGIANPNETRRHTIGAGSAVIVDITAPATDIAKQWDGWGTALKPAWEPIILARKPLIGTVAANVAAHGTGGLNIDGCRIGTEGGMTRHTRSDGDHRDRWDGNTATGEVTLNGGRWPANVCLDEDAAAMLDAQSGTSDNRSGGRSTRATASGTLAKGMGSPGRDVPRTGHNDAGGASRFFYCAKASRSEREAGLDGLPEEERRALGDFEGTAEHAPKQNVRAKNHHPTVKPIALMRWLCRLVTPPGGLILDPFTGSGTTGCAAVLEGFRFVGIEQSPEYAAIAEKRIAHHIPEPKLL